MKPLYVLFFLTATTLAQHATEPIVGLHDNKPNVLALVHANVHVSADRLLEDASLIVRDSRIEAVGKNVRVPPDATVRDMQGKTIYPGFIDLYSHYGMPSAEKQDGTQKKNDETGTRHWSSVVHSEKRAADLLKIDKKATQKLLKWGFTAVCSYPPEGMLRGWGALVLLSGEKPAQSVLRADIAQAFTLTRDGRSGERGVKGYPRSLMGRIAMTRQTLLDAEWYRQANRPALPTTDSKLFIESNPALEALQPCLLGEKPVVMQTAHEQDILRAAALAREFNLDMWVLGTGTEYRRLEAIRQTGLRMIVPLNFPSKPDVTSREKELNVTLRTLKHWDTAPENPARLAAKEVDFVLTTMLLEKKDGFITRLRTAVERGLSPQKAIYALTAAPAEWLGMAPLLGSLEKGKMANFIVTDGDFFDKKSGILETWVAGQKTIITPRPQTDLSGSWALELTSKTKTDTGKLEISGKGFKIEAKLSVNKQKIEVKKTTWDDLRLTLSFAGDSLHRQGMVRMSGLPKDNLMDGHGVWGDGSRFLWRAKRTAACTAKADTSKKTPPVAAAFPVVFPDGAYGINRKPEQPVVLLLKNAAVWTGAEAGIRKNTDILVKNGKIESIGPDIKAPAEAVLIDAAGKHITPGIIDAHSHIAITGGTNEGTHAITAEVNVKDIVYSDDIQIYRQLASGVTTVCTMHGSANPIAGKYAVLKLRWGCLPGDMIVQDAGEGIKMALGENVKQSNYSYNPAPRYPQTRMGVMEIIRDAFQAARDYGREWEIYRQRPKKDKNITPPRRILRYETLLEVLEGKTAIHCHAYRHDEMLALMQLAEEMNFKIDVFIHILEGYKIAPELKNHGAMATTFSDWWAYKAEAYDAIPYNAAVMHQQGVVVSLNSDSPELARRLNTEASKAVKYGGVDPHEALKMITLNAAKQLFIDHRTGSLEPGKDADFVIWNASPLSTYAACEQTWIEGRKYFDASADSKMRKQIQKQRTVLVQKILSGKSQKGKEK